MKNILFICSANKDRSKTAEDYFSKQHTNISFNSAGTNKNTCNKLGTNFISIEQLDVADTIYVMENKHRRSIKTIFGNSYYNKIIVLNINDIYKYGAKELIDILKIKVSL